MSSVVELSQSIQKHTVPLCQGEFACGTADLILVEAGHQFSAHFDVGASVATLLIVIWRRKNRDNLQRRRPHIISPDECSSLFTTADVYLSTVTQLITLLFALVGSDEQLESVLEQQPSGDVGAEVTASSPERVGTAALQGFWVTPQYIYNLSGETISLSVSDSASHHSRTEPGSDLLPFLFMLRRWRSRQRVQERQLEDTATGWGRVRMRRRAGRSFQGAEGNGRGGWRGWRRSGGGAVLPVRPASPLPTRIYVQVT